MSEKILDYEPQNITQENASKSQRFVNSFLDGIVLYVIGLATTPIGMNLLGGMSQTQFQEAITANPGDAMSIMTDYIWRIIIVTYFVHFVYATCFEFFTQGKSTGKYASKTRVVSNDGNPLTLQQCVIRSLCRFIPFNALSIFFGGENTMWHDNFSGTRVVVEG
jgi:uncharacterized RDD family membrane protein YckC